MFLSMHSTRRQRVTTTAHAPESGSVAAKQQPAQTRVTRMGRASISSSARARFVVAVVLTGVHCCSGGERAINKYPTSWVRNRALQFCGQIPPAPPRTRGTVQYLCDNDRVCGGFGDRLRGMTQLWIDAMDESADFEAVMVSGRNTCATPRRPSTLLSNYHKSLAPPPLCFPTLVSVWPAAVHRSEPRRSFTYNVHAHVAHASHDSQCHSLNITRTMRI